MHIVVMHAVLPESLKIGEKNHRFSALKPFWMLREPFQFFKKKELTYY
jgi:hypothetical protein